MKHIMTTRISKETITRLLKDVKQIMKNPLTENGIYYIHDDTDILKGYALIIGPSDTPYFGGNYFFEFTYPADYPHTPPAVKYWTNGNNVRFNPNLYVCGKVCVSLLNTWRGDQWTSCQSISTVLLTLCTLLCKDPLLNEPGVEKGHRDMTAYNFYPFVRENFNKNFDKFIEFAEKKHRDLGNVATDLRTGFYSMTIRADYGALIDRLKSAHAIAKIM